MTPALLDKSRATADESVRQTQRLAVVLEYDGTRYAGSQRQSNAPSVQAELEQALLALSGEHVRVSLAGRTDAGVHARGQVASFTTAAALPLRAFIFGLNHHLPADIVVTSARAVADDFDPRRSARHREYEYHILSSHVRSPLRAGRAYQLPGRLDTGRMSAAAKILIGTHDFASFATALPAGKSTLREISQAQVRREGELVIVRLVANAFLPHQVRNTVGALIQVGQGRLSQAEFAGILAARRPSLAGPAAPACGLYLNKVYYDNSIEERTDENL